MNGLKITLIFSKGADCFNAGFLFRGIQTNTASPANAVSERTFIARRVSVIKNFMGSNSTQKRLNIPILLYVHKNMPDILTVATKCFDNSDHRKPNFGAFSPLNLETAVWQ